MRDFDTFKAYCPPLIVVPGTETSGGPFVGGGSIGDNYPIAQSGWNAVLEDPGKIATSPGSLPSGAYYLLRAYHKSKFEWTPFARQDFAIDPVGQDIAEGTNFRSFYSTWPGFSTGSGAGQGTFPQWAGVDCKVVDIWSSEELEENMIENLAWNGILPGAEPAYDLDTFSRLYLPRNDPDTIDHKIRSDQIISARYRQMVSSTNAPEAKYFGGQLMTIHDSTIGGNASISDYIHHVRYVYIIASNDGTDQLDYPPNAGAAFNYTRVGFFVPSAIDTLTFAIAKVDNDAEWATIARRGATR